MLRFLFGRLTERPKPAQALFDRLVEEARHPHWFVEGQVPDTIDGRFAMLATICALAIVRIEQADSAATRSAALTERFVETMDAEHRQMGLNDPGLGKRVRKLVGILARRTGQWREAVAGQADWGATTRASVYRDAAVELEALAHSGHALRALWSRLAAVSGEELGEGRF